MIPSAYHVYLHLNPLSPLFKAYQDIFVDSLLPTWSSLWPLLLLCLALNCLGLFLFSRRSEEMVDEL